MRESIGFWVFAAILFPAVARAECALIDPAVSLKNASFVFSGTVVNVEWVRAYWVVSLTPDEVWKGDPPRQVTVSQANTAEAIRFARGGKYLIFAYPYFEPSESQLREAGMFPLPPDLVPPMGLMSVSPCDSGPLDEPNRINGTLRFLGPGRTPVAK